MRVKVGDTRLYFDVEGAQLVPAGPWMQERPTVVLLHTGPGADHSAYKDHVGPALARDAQVLYLDMRGSGRSDWSTPEHWTLERWVEDLVGFCDALELERPILLGTSIGGTIALQHAAREPARVDRLVLVSTVARYVHTRAIAVFDRLGGALAGETAARYFAHPTEATFADFLRVCVPLYTRNSSPDTVARMEMNLALTAHWDQNERDFDIRTEAGRIACPTLVLAGEDDPSTTIVGTEELVEALPPALTRFHRFANAGHGVFRDAPEAIELVRAFVLEEREER
jgi:proline iminopeptidase